MSEELKYKVGDSFNIRATIVEVDPSNLPYRVELSVGYDFWMTDEGIDKCKMETDPSYRKQKLKEQIDKLQQEYNELENV